jgi:glycosyltransferase involved in cell wall biosynthesis
MSVVGVYFSGKSGGVDVVGSDICVELQMEGHDVHKLVGLKQLIYSMLSKRCSNYFLCLNAGIFGILGRSIYVVHGFPRIEAYGRFRFIFVWLGHVVSMYACGRIVYVSELTQLVWTQLLWGRRGTVILNKHYASNKIGSANEKTMPKDAVALYVGRIVREKRVFEAIQAFNNSGLKAQGVKFYVVGSGPDLQRCSTLEDESVIFTGFITEAEKVLLFRRAMVFVSLQEFEPMGLTYLEASRFGCRVVAPLYSGASETVPKNFLFHCNPVDLHSISEALRTAFGSEILDRKPLSNLSYSQLLFS